MYDPIHFVHLDYAAVILILMVIKVALCRPPGPVPKPWYDDLETLHQAITRHGSGRLELVDRAIADAILVFHDNPASDVLCDVFSFLKATERHKAFVYSTLDHVFPFLPGFYPSLPRKNSIPGTRGCPYLTVMRSAWLDELPSQVPQKWLFSFAGNLENAAVRKSLKLVADPRGYVKDTASHPGNLYGQTAETYLNFRNSYVDLLRDSQFILCPRGCGPSSVRLYETLRAGRVPVILSDAWVPPTIVPWDHAAITIPESAAGCVGDILREREKEVEERCRQARLLWDHYFGAEGIIHWLYQQFQQLLGERELFYRNRWRLICKMENIPLVLRTYYRSFRKRTY